MSENAKNSGYNEFPWRDGNWVNTSYEGNKYQFLKDSKLGTGGYRSGTYLIPHKRENLNDYQIRQSKNYYSNQYRPIWQAHFKPIFKNDAVRTTTELTTQFEALYKVFLENCDGKGTHLQNFVEKSAGETKNLGASFIVVNNDIEIDSTIEDVITQRVGVPYAFLITPDMVYDYDVDSFGNLVKLRWVQQDGEITYDGLGQADSINLVNSFTPNTEGGAESSHLIVGVDAEFWYVYDDQGEVQQMYPNTIGEIPVVRLTSEPTDEIIPESDLYAVARIQNRIYNLASIITDIADNQGFSILTMPMTAQSGVDFSTTKGLGYPQDSSNKPEFISPDANQLKTLIELYQSQINELYQAGVVNHLQRFQQSAESKELDRARLNDLLGTFTGQIEQAERKVMYLFGLYVGFNYEYNVVYSRDFGVSTLAEDIETFEALKSSGISTELSVELEKGIARRLVEFEDESDLDNLLDAIESEQVRRRDEASLESQFLIQGETTPSNTVEAPEDD